MPKTGALIDSNYIDLPGGSYLKEIICIEFHYTKNNAEYTYPILLYYYNKRLIFTDMDGNIVDRIELFFTPKKIVEIIFKDVKSKRKKFHHFAELIFECTDCADEVISEVYSLSLIDTTISLSDQARHIIGSIHLDAISGTITKINFSKKEYKSEEEEHKS